MRALPPPTPEQAAHIRLRREQGADFLAISIELEVSYHAAWSWARDLGLSSARQTYHFTKYENLWPRSPDEAKDKQILATATEGIQVAAADMNVTKYAVMIARRRLGIKNQNRTKFLPQAMIPPPVNARDLRFESLPAGHPETWGALMALTPCLENAAFGGL